MSRLDSMEDDFRHAKNHVYGLAHNVAFLPGEQRALLSYIGEVEYNLYKEGASGERIIIELLGIIMDGLKYGNWPWIRNGLNTLEQRPNEARSK